MKKKKLLIILSVLLIIAAGLLWGNNSIKTTEYTVSPENLPESFDGFRIVQVSDLHNTDFGNGLIEKISDAKPDIIVITGDIIDSYHTEIPIAVEFAERVCEIAPVYYVTGNHEHRIDGYEILKTQLEKAGFIILEGETVEITRNGEKISLTGIDDTTFFGSEILDEQIIAFSQKLKSLAAEADEDINILLSHRPEHFSLYTECDFDVVFSGHAHGGQIRLPFLGGVYAPGQGFFPEYTEGVHTSGETNMVISRGLGNSLFPLRVFNRPEIVICNLGETK